MFLWGLSDPWWTVSGFFHKVLQGTEQQIGPKLQIAADCINETAHAGSMHP